MSKDHTVYLQDIVDAMRSIEAFTEDMSFAEFKDDDKTVSAVLRKFEVIGEATKRLPEHVKDDHEGIAWDAMARMRDKVIHFYQDVDHRIVWQTIQNRVPKDKERLENLLQKDH
jgi:uncharacterized protein with HEPN domain